MLINYSDRAVQDLEKIFAYITRDQKSHAKTFLNNLKNKIELLALFPDMGVECRRKQIPIDGRLLIYEDYLIFYRARGKTF
ncbi:MAG: type II toxin-antitoxin system RelE/ParE family toxin [Hydrogenovibrio sp.]|uniref:type II toxin-antitoxin system RelE/ParE family toxin n=1 Tax=Hydrogenovibrio sp. TaxID=2065821 RepID=UPI002870B3A0|nr:type II toxin-antitoxin system RelE/ParE family toxin [Hydrogenovibrio sp.]MDR9498545.1 type II toxin-antitoxin system RelE/ParE family toxin [Hydrogenovibrio sp.]MDR9499225.1 type II toxin-antitoxin system RelE/ParE family toxin [Hydrogenovibrio sp.]